MLILYKSLFILLIARQINIKSCKKHCTNFLIHPSTLQITNQKQSVTLFLTYETQKKSAN